MTGSTPPAELHARLPACRVLILTTFGRPGYLRRALEAGAAGFLLKDAPATELAAAIRRVVAGERVVDPGLAAAALSAGRQPADGRASARCSRAPAASTPRSPSSRPRCTSRRAPCATTSPRRCGKLGARNRRGGDPDR